MCQVVRSYGNQIALACGKLTLPLSGEGLGRKRRIRTTGTNPTKATLHKQPNSSGKLRIKVYLVCCPFCLGK